ncbi:MULTISPECIES: phytanoyl-CoA dioxygenase family protein [unclassified Streptomyces]|uniref:phytanoyl-CoA dioxygenase family protein n=1 Tax=unclassified Streptomyces TaxID=2593676 RepID=UPI000DBABB42|nr:MULTISPECIES: phytanoyl-CoA dioxygenase family protein [unclassified Streptomyces]MYT68217.1 phytanoyl-CoA dioxygenase [Streptomyces sp. SID8367]RAJ76849.1 phytanoyl-CoA dioxygenase PhyH [Streptomyces sp. PsTaAH-137]
MTAGLFCARGYRLLNGWCRPETARACAAERIREHEVARTTVIRDQHVRQEWAQSVVRTPRLLYVVRNLLGPDVAVPWQLDGVIDRHVLDAGRSVSLWLALTDTTAGLHVIPGSQRADYPPYGGAVQRQDLAQGLSIERPAGSGLLMDTRLVHRCLPHQGSAPRVAVSVRYVAPGAVARREHAQPDLRPVSGTSW